MNNDKSDDDNSAGDGTTAYKAPAPSTTSSNFRRQNNNIPESTFGNNMSFSPVNTVNPRRLTVTSTTPSTLTPINDFNAIPRSETEISTFDPIVNKANRPTSDKELTKLRETATTPLANSFSLLSIEDSDKQLANTYDITMRVEEVRAHLKTYDLIDVFFILNVDNNNENVLLSGTIDLLDHFQTLSEHEVRKSIRYFKRFGKHYVIQNLAWSADMLLKSCEQDLRDKVAERLMLVSEDEKGGPLTFFYILSEITSFSEDAVAAMERRLTDMSIKEFEGENVSTAVSQLRTSISRLTLLNKLPVDIVKRLLLIFQTSSVSEFNDLFKMIALQRRGNRGHSFHDSNDILTLASETYRELLENGSWNNVNGSRLNVCFRCNQDGHIAKDCTVIKDTPSDNTTPTPFNTKKGWTSIKDPNGKLTITKHDKTWFWCEKCKRYNTSHTTETHVKKGETVPPVPPSSAQPPPTATNVVQGDRSADVDLDSAPSDPSLCFTSTILDGLQKF